MKTHFLIRWISIATLTLLYFPLVILVVYSFLDRDPATGNTSWTFRWYVEAIQDDSLMESLFVSLRVGFWTTVLSTILGVSAALGLERSRFPGRRLLDMLTLLPLVVPEIVFGLALLMWFVLLRLTLGELSLALAHTTFCFSYVLLTVRSRLHDYDQTLDEAAKDLGANGWQIFYRITLPILFPAILSGALLAFTVSFDDFLISFFTAGVGSDTLPMKLYAMIRFGVSPKVNALSTLILAATIAGVILTIRPRSRKNPDRKFKSGPDNRDSTYTKKTGTSL